MTDLIFTLGTIRRHKPCKAGWVGLLTGLGVGKAYDPDMRVSLGDVAIANGADDALWCLRCLDWDDLEIRRAVISGVVLPAVKRAAAYTPDQRVHDCIAVLERWCAGDDTVDLTAVWAATRTAAAAESAWAAGATGAAWAAGAAAWDARAAGAAGAAAWDAEREQQRRDIIAAFPPIVIKER
jgi:hypothetical protein